MPERREWRGGAGGEKGGRVMEDGLGQSGAGGGEAG